MTQSALSWIDSLIAERTPSPAIGRVLAAVSADIETAAFATAGQIADLAGVNVASATRCAQYLGYRGWPDFVADLRGHYLASLTADRIMPTPASHESAEGGEAGPVLRASLSSDIRMLALLADSIDADAVAAASAFITAARRTAVLATGYCAGPGGVLAHGGQLFGFDVEQYSGAASAQINAVRRLGEDDALVVFHVWKTAEVIGQLALDAASRGVPVIAIADRSGPVTEAAAATITVSSGSPQQLPSMTGVFAVVNGLLKVIAASDRAAVEDELRGVDEMWHRLGVVAD